MWKNEIISQLKIILIEIHFEKIYILSIENIIK